MKNRKKGLVAAQIAMIAFGVLGAVPSAKGNSILLSDPNKTFLGPNLYEYQTTATLSSDSYVQSGESFFTVFDVVGYIAGSASFSSAGWSVTTMNSGLVAFLQNPPDNPGIVNLVVQLTGANVATAGPLGVLTFRSEYDAGGSGYYNGFDRRTSDNTKQGNSGELQGMPTDVPEPATTALIGASLIGLGVLRRRLN